VRREKRHAGLLVSTINVIRTAQALPENLDAARELLFGSIDGFNRDDKKAWRSFWKRLIGMEPGEMAVIEARMPRSGPYHRRHMKIEQSVFDAQERFTDFESLRYWLKVGAAWVTWAAGPKGGVVPIPKSISYAKADEAEFRKYHEQVVMFLRGEHAARYLWPHLGEGAHDMMNTILEGFDE